MVYSKKVQKDTTQEKRIKGNNKGKVSRTLKKSQYSHQKVESIAPLLEFKLAF